MIDTTYKMFVETEVPENELIISRTDLKGVITYVNDTFAEISGYEAEELIGQAHNIVRHPDMPKSAFDDVWQKLKEGNSWQGYIKNMRKDGGYYWVEADISGVYKDGELVEYKSVRSPMTDEKKLQMQDLYDRVRAEQEDKQRVVTYLSASQIKKLESIL